MTDSGPVSSEAAQSARRTAGGDAPADPSLSRHAGERWAYWVPALVLVVGLAVTGVLVWISASTYSNNENRLLSLRARDAGALIAGALQTVQTPLASAAALADATGGDVQKFDRFIAPSVGPQRGRTFTSVSLWRLAPGQSGPMTVVGAAPVLAGAPARARAFFERTARRGTLGVTGLLNAAPPRLGYAFTSPGLSGRFVAYAESALPSNRRSKFQSSSSFADLDYALYLGRSQNGANLLVTDLTTLPITARHASITIPFGDSALTFVVTPRHPLEGPFPQRLPWAIGIVGVLLTLGAAALTVRLIDRRNQAEDLAGSLEVIADENRRLYAEQRTIAQTLQHALLPEDLPTVPGVETAARYEAGVEGVDIGGDWYDLIRMDERRLLLVVGDVSGRGLRAAATMASLRFAIHAYAAQGDSPSTILTKLTKLTDVKATGQLTTVLCALVDIESHEVTVASAGHLPPLLMSDGTGTFIETAVGVPIGVSREASYPSAAVAAPPEATLLAFTDGLVERRGESLDDGLARLRRAATGRGGDLDELLDGLIGDLRRDGVADDTAIAGLRWLN